MIDLNPPISIIIPAFNAGASISLLFKDLLKVFAKFSTQIIIVNDCSTDTTHEECLKLIKENDSELTYIKLSKNVGEHNAVMAGLKHSTGDWIIVMDDDFQNPPSEALKLLNYSLSNKFDVVYGNYKKKKHNLFRNLMSKINDLTANYILNKPKGLYLSSFKTINSKIVKKISNYNGPFPYIDGLIISLTSNISSIETQHDERKSGKSGYSLLKLLKLYGNMATNFSTVPLHICSLMGLFVGTLSGIYAVIIIIQKIINPSMALGYASIFVAIMFFAGVQLIFMGLLGEYIGKVLKNVNKEPQYSIDYIKLNEPKK
jgi:polyisoprenyl-phosphate glycosyltransferase